ncbi:MAG TPA: UvrD-helicase domain-containing protein, partial [Gemmatimonadota bacterium]|nr:UvrD-helicase domain-containing protein [Gemmatimonadota bacterium]
AKDAAKALCEEVIAFGAEGSLAERTLSRWYAHRYPAVLAFARHAADDYAAERLRTGRLTFQDLLLHAARLLRESPSARGELGKRYRRLLVDEFQDTDPIQAEVVFLLAADDPDETDWRKTVARPGALFVVGDPKQSIYRFRRADIAIYQQAKRCFEAWRDEDGKNGGDPRGDVLELIANFRSRPSIGAFVDEEWRRRFPREATGEQAAFAPLATRRGPAEPGETEGVWCYTVQPADPGRDMNVATEDAARVAAWIDARIKAGERKPGDFLILPYHRKFLARYAEALEARNIPVQVTGSEILIEDELAELRLLLAALTDPSDETLAVAVLIGLFFGIDHEELARHALEEGSFRIAGAPRGLEGPVADAMATLRDWWKLSRRVPADVAVETIVEDLGLVPYAAASGLGAARAGAIGYVLQVIREIGLEGDTSLRAAIEALDVTLEQGEAEAPLEPGREDVVRIMNLHRAKGTEAPIVVLAAPTGWEDFPPWLRVARSEDGGADGWTEIKSSRQGGFVQRIVARPLDWLEHQRVEQQFEAAQVDRLLYVAVTRAADELLVSRCPDRRAEKRSFWQPLYARLTRDVPPRELEGVAPEGRRELSRTAQSIVAEAEAIRRERELLATPSYLAVAATEIAKAGGEAILTRGSGGRGREWGTSVHTALEAAVRGAEGDTLRAVGRAALLANERPVRPDGEPRELDELVALAESIAGSELFARARAAEPVLAEVPFAWRRERDGRVEIVEGVVDLAFREPDGWVLADWKTDVVEDAAVRAARQELYQRQLDLYAEAWEALTGEPVKERLLVSLADR